MHHLATFILYVKLKEAMRIRPIHSVTLPFIVSVLLVSNTALPWCANSSMDTLRKPNATANTEMALFLIGIASIAKMPFLEPTKQSP